MSGNLSETFKKRIRTLLKEQSRAQNYDEEGFLSYVEQALTSDDVTESEKKQLLQDCLVRLMPPSDAAQLCSLIIVLYNQLYPALINLQVTATGWLVCPFGPHILPAHTMKKHLNLNHFEQMKGYSYDNGRLVPINAPSPTSSSTSSASSSSFSPASSSTSASSSFQQPSPVPASQVFAALAERNLVAAQLQQNMSGMGRGSRTWSSSDLSAPQLSGWQQSGGLPPLEFMESKTLDDIVSQSFEEIQKYLPELFDGEEFQGITASLFDICCDQHYSSLICARLQGANPETRRLFLQEIMPEVVGLCCSQHGSTIMQYMIDQGTTKQRQMIFSQLEESFVKLALSSSGSKLLTTLMPHLSGNEMLELAVEELKASLSQVMLSPSGSTLVIDLLPNLSTSHSTLFFGELLRNFGELIKDPVASSAIASIVQLRLSTVFNASAFKKLKGNVVRYSQDEHAFKIVKVFIKNGPAQNRRLIIDEIINTSTLGSRAIVQLTQSPSGRFVVQAILESGEEDQKKALAKQIQDDLKDKELLVAKNQKSAASSPAGPNTPIRTSSSQSPSPSPSPSASSTSLNQGNITPQTEMRLTPRAIPRPLISQISVPDEDYFSSSSTSLSTSQMSSPESTPESTPPRRKSPDPGVSPKIDVSFPVPFVGTPFVNQESIMGITESLVPDSDRGAYWADKNNGPSPVVEPSAPPPKRSTSAKPGTPIATNNQTTQPPKKFASETVVSVALDEEDLSEDELYQLYPDLGEASGEEESEDDDDDDDWKRFDWTVHDFDIQDFFQPEWSETDMLEQQDYVSFLNILGLEGEETEGIKWKPNDLCEAKLSEDSDKWLLGKVIKTAKDHSKYKVWFPLLGTTKVEVVNANCMRPALKQLGAETFQVLEGSNVLSGKGFGGFKSVGGSRPKKR